MISIEAFEYFYLEPKNSSIVNEEKFGVLCIDKKNKTWIPTIITKDDFARYVHDIYFDDEEEQEFYKLLAMQFNEQYKMWPLVKKITW